MPVNLTPIEELDQHILTLCTRINSATCELLVMIREFDERAGWLQWGLDNCAEWLAWRWRSFDDDGEREGAGGTRVEAPAVDLAGILHR